MFVSGTASDLPSNEPQYSLKNGVILQVNPGVFFYWVTVTTTSAGQDFQVTQTITGNTFSTPFGIANGTFAWSSSCVKLAAYDHPIRQHHHGGPGG